MVSYPLGQFFWVLVGDVLDLLLVEEQNHTEHNLSDHHQRHDRTKNAENAWRLPNSTAATEEREYKDEHTQGGYSVGDAVETVLIDEFLVINLYHFGEYADAQVD